MSLEPEDSPAKAKQSDAVGTLREFYDQKAPIYHSDTAHVGDREEVILELFPRRAGLRLLDVGCGSGRFLRIARDRGHEVSGLEISPRAAAAAEGLRVIVGNPETGEGLGQVGSGFDVITLLDVLEHTFDPARVLRTLRPLLAPGGVMIVSVPNVGCLPARLTLLAGSFPSESSGIFDAGHIRWFTRSNLAGYVAQAGGLKLGRCSGSPIPPFQVRGYWRVEQAHRALARRLARRWPGLWGYQLIFELFPEV
jgi:2-polyprenyl-3-methyl-5-hydroxy-6-metoxy-1,4-benzoquinol methylase